MMSFRARRCYCQNRFQPAFQPAHCSGLNCNTIDDLTDSVSPENPFQASWANGFAILPVASEPYALRAFLGRPPLAPLARAALAFASDFASPPCRPSADIQALFPKTPATNPATLKSRSSFSQWRADPRGITSTAATSRAAGAGNPGADGSG